MQLGIKLVYADDNELTLLLTRAWLRDLGMHAEIARNGQEAARMVEGLAVDLLLMDLCMPIMSGLDAAVSIRNSSSVVRQPVIYIISADSSESLRNRCRGANVDGVWSKPTVFSDFKELICRGLRDVAKQHR